MATTITTISSTFECGCIHTFAGPLGALTEAVRCDAHSATAKAARGIDFSRKPAADEAALAEIVRWMRLSA